MRMELVLRFDYGSIVPWVRRRRRRHPVAIAGPDAVAFATPVELRGEDLRTVADFTVREGERVPFVLTWYPSHRDAAARRSTPEQRSQDTERLLAGLVDALHVRAATGATRCIRVAHRAEGAHVRADRRHRRRADDLAAGAARRRPQLGLPLLLAARRHASRCSR